MKARSMTWPLVSVLIGIFVLTGCPPKKKLEIAEKPTDEQVQEEPKIDDAATAKDPSDIEIKQDWTDIPSLQVVQFGYDSATLDDAARSVLKNNVAIIKKLPKTVVVRVEGHCDDRGTVEYNIALGQRRANAVRSYYATAGVGKNRLDTISFGEERPVCNELTDACWAMNRRGATKVKNAQPVIIKASDLK